MSNRIDCKLHVLAASPKEMNDIAAALLEPSRESSLHIIEWEQRVKREQKIDEIATQIETEAQPPEDAEIEGLRELIGFQIVRNLGDVDDSLHKARRFQKTYYAHNGLLVGGLLREVSVAFPSAIFFFEPWDLHSWGRRMVIRNGVVEQSVEDSHTPLQLGDWILLDIFAPFLAEYNLGLPFRSLWSKWVDDLVAAADELRKQSRSVQGKQGLSPIPE